MIKYIYGFILVTAIGIMYEKYRMKYYPDNELNKIGLITEFFLNDNNNNLGKPILWIHASRDVNARYWESFNSRNSDKLNQPFIISCVETIIKHCGKSFNICLIDDKSFNKLLPNWKIDLDRLADPVKKHVRQLALMKTLYNYGGMLLPNSTIVMKDLKPVYLKGIKDKSCFAVEGINKTSSADMLQLIPMTNIIGCKKKSPCMKDLIGFLERKISSDSTDEWNFLGETNKFLYKLYNENKLSIVSGKTFGIIDNQFNMVLIENLMSNSFIDFDKTKLHAIYIPSEEILSRTQYQWFARLSQQQLRDCDNMAAKYLLIAQE
jgi:hypothetical protein